MHSILLLCVGLPADTLMLFLWGGAVQLANNQLTGELPDAWAASKVSMPARASARGSSRGGGRGRKGVKAGA